VAKQSGALAGLAAAVVLAVAGCGGGGYGGIAAQKQREAEHPCQFSSTSEKCKVQLEAEKRHQEAHHETKALDERARVEAERARLKSESGQ
jgi:uncharacterized protein HemX